MSNELPTIRAEDCFFAADVVVGDTPNEDAKSAPVELTARSGDAVDHHVWGRVVHDFDGMQHKSRIALDYNHNPDEVVGYGNRFNHETGDLVIKGALTPFKDSDRGTEILAKARQGVPYEASIYFAGPMKVERLDRGDKATINGREFTGPLTVIRKWHLRGVAICPYGYDHQTQAVALSNSDRDIAVTVIEKESTAMSDTTKDTKVVEDQTVDATEDSNSQEAVAVAETQTAVDGQAELSTPEGSSRPAADYWDAFGKAQGSVYFAEGLPFDVATARELKRVSDENSELRKRVQAQAQDGHDDAVEFSHGDVEPPKSGHDKDGKLTEVPIKFTE